MNRIEKLIKCKIQKLILISAVLTISSGCSSMGKSIRNFISGKESKETPQQKVAGVARFSDNENLRAPGGDKQFKKMNRQKFEEEAELKADAGSLWVMEGQGAYLFSQNQIRMVGDLLNVKIEGAPKTQLQTKVKVISKLLDRLDNPGRGLASQSQAGQNPGAAPAGSPAGANPQPGNAQNQNANQNQQAQNPSGGPAEGADGSAAAAGKSEGPFAVQAVPTRIVEQLRDGSYRVRGMQPFMIGKREYKVIVTGVIRPEDFDDAGVDANKLLDPQFDIVSSKKGVM